jgi:hypothetical protein
MLNDVYSDKKENSDRTYWQHTNKHLAAIEMDAFSNRKKRWYRRWIPSDAYYSLNVDPDSIDQQVVSLRLVRFFRSNNLKTN